MTSFEHKSLIKRIDALDRLSEDQKEYSRWIQAEDHLSFLRGNAAENEVILFASGKYTYVHSLAVPIEKLSPVNKRDLLAWSSSPFTSIAGYVSGGGREGVWIEREHNDSGSETLKNSTQLVFGRSFEGWQGERASYFEVHQEYAHLNRMHWRSSGHPEKLFGRNSVKSNKCTNRNPAAAKYSSNGARFADTRVTGELFSLSVEDTTHSISPFSSYLQ